MEFVGRVWGEQEEKKIEGSRQRKQGLPRQGGTSNWSVSAEDRNIQAVPWLKGKECTLDAREEWKDFGPGSHLYFR